MNMKSHRFSQRNSQDETISNWATPIGAFPSGTLPTVLFMERRLASRGRSRSMYHIIIIKAIMYMYFMY